MNATTTTAAKLTAGSTARLGAGWKRVTSVQKLANGRVRVLAGASDRFDLPARLPVDVLR